MGMTVGMHTVSKTIEGMHEWMFIVCGDDWGDAHRLEYECGCDCGEVYK